MMAPFLLEPGKVPLAFVYATDVAADPSFPAADRLPEAIYIATAAASASTRSSSRDHSLQGILGRVLLATTT
jgi:hypothetical protein